MREAPWLFKTGINFTLDSLQSCFKIHKDDGPFDVAFLFTALMWNCNKLSG